MNNKQVVEAYAKASYVFPNSGESDVSGSNPAKSLFFVGNRIYSYGHHFLIAEKTGNKEVVVTTRKYSCTTSHHVSLVASVLENAGYTITRKEL